MKNVKKEKPSLIEARQEKEKEALLEQLEKVPIVHIACAKAGVGRTTYYRWLREDKEFCHATDECRQKGIDAINDLAESVIIKKIQEGDVGAAKYWLNHNHPNYHAKSQAPPRSDDQPRIIYLNN